MAEILSGARKYRIGLTLAHHELHQLQRSPEVASAVMTHPFTRIVFRVGDDDAKKLAESFSFFESKDLRNLETGQAVCRVERSDFDFNLSVPLFPSPDATAVAARREEVITCSREKYGTARADVEAMLAKSRGIVPMSHPPVESRVPVFPESQAPRVAEVAPLPPPVPVPQTSEPPKVPEKPKAKPDLTAPRRELPRDLGRGGAQHKAIQQRLKAEAEKMGFLATIEKEIQSGSIDLLVERPDYAIACEISVTTTIDHEVGNVQKCIQAGFAKVAIICQEDVRSQKIKEAVISSLGREAAKCVICFRPEEFVAHLKSLVAKAQPRPVSDETNIRRGYKVKRTISKLAAEEHKAREDAAIAQIADLLKRRPAK
jgi:hypothetical protein